MTPPCSGAVPGVESHPTAAEPGGATYDLAFAGAGLAAVSLAVRLAALPDPPKIILIDPRTEFPRDRTWCHWQLHETPFDHAITHRWHRWTVRTPTAGTVAAATAPRALRPHPRRPPSPNRRRKAHRLPPRHYPPRRFRQHHRPTP